MIKVKHALISVSDKTGLVEFVKGLQALGVEILSTGGTARLLRGVNIPVKEVSEYTGFPEILDGRVKTLHPAIHGGLLALRDKQSHMEELSQHNIGLIDLVVVNLYPFQRVTEKSSVSLEEALENIDIGGPSMLRSAAKNFKSVAVICNPQRYKDVLRELTNNNGLLPDTVLINLAIEIFQYTAEYDNNIYYFLNRRMKVGEFPGLPPELTLRYQKAQDLRYGENPHQKGAFYHQRDTTVRGLAKIEQLHGKELSFNNLLDIDAAVNIVKEFDEPAAVVVKHNNPTGIAENDTLAKAYHQAWSCDSVSAFGGIVGFNRKVDVETAELLVKSGFMECIIAPDFQSNALKILSQKKNLRIIQLERKDMVSEPLQFKQVTGGLLLQEEDNKMITAKDLKCVTKKPLMKNQIDSILFGWKAVKHVRSNAIILVKGKKTVGIGCGQTSRIESSLIALKKAGKNAKNSILISDAFFPKTDNVITAAKAGVKVIVQTGGSVADADVIEEANKAKIVMVMTGVRHFKH